MPDPKDLMKRGANVVAQRGIQRDVERAARAQAGYTDTVIWLSRADIIIDETIQVRIGGVDPATVEQYSVVMYESKGWGPFPPVVLFRDGEALYLSAGFQRMAAADRASDLLVKEGTPGIDTVPCEVRPGGYAAALEYAEDDNLDHGKPLSYEDKRHLFERRLACGHHWGNVSNRVIAQELGVGRNTIARWRGSWESSQMTGPNGPVDTTTRIGADGRVYDVGRVQDANRERAERGETPSKPRVSEPEQSREYEEQMGGEPGAWFDPARQASKNETVSNLPNEPEEPADGDGTLLYVGLSGYIGQIFVGLNELIAIRNEGYPGIRDMNPDQLAALAENFGMLLNKMAHSREFIADMRDVIEREARRRSK